MSTTARMSLAALATLLGLLLIAPEAFLVWPYAYVTGVSVTGVNPLWVRFGFWATTASGGVLIGLGLFTLLRRL